jgi:hypothetical protein
LVKLDFQDLAKLDILHFLGLVKLDFQDLVKLDILHLVKVFLE